MCGQPLADERSADQVVQYEKRLEGRLRKQLMPQAMAAAEDKYAERLSQATHQTDDLRRKLDARSARELGVEQQDALLALLQKAFPEDDLVLVGDNGTGDLAQTVRSGSHDIGRILHESKKHQALAQPVGAQDQAGRQAATSTAPHH